MSAKSNGGKRELYVRLPTKSYRKLRSMARLPPIEITGNRHAVLLRLPPEAHDYLRKCALQSSARAVRIVGMQSVLSDMILEAKLDPKREKASMSAVAARLIRGAKTT